ncbi:MAG: ribosome maturation factor RimP [Acidimicrobiaceae bacterium]|nr:ribosome maturation factor RimP [Acidimicrobiaceae bacterium]
MLAQKIEDRLREVAESELADQGLEILDIELKGGSLRVTLDSETSLDLDRVSKASHLISRLIDDSVEFDDMGQFTLEVSSPGLERLLRTEAHFRRFIGSKVIVKTKPEYSGPRRFGGVIKSVGEGSITLQLDDPSAGLGPEMEVRIIEIERAHTLFEWGSPKSAKAKSGSGSKQASNKTNLTANKIAKD